MSSIDEVLAHADATELAIALSNLVFPRWGSDGYAALTQGEQVAYCVDTLEREVNNGGFHQFFANSSGDTARETVTALRAIGAAAAADIVARAITAFPGGAAPSDRGRRCELLDGASEATRETWLALDDEFYGYPDDDLTTLMRRFVEAHGAEFRPQ